MTTTVTIAAQRRSGTGKGVARKLRASGLVPAIVYGRGRESESVSVSATELERTMSHISGTTIVNLDVDGSVVRTLIRDVQRHPVKSHVMHVDFYEIHEGVTLTLEVPIHLVGSPDGVRNAGGVLDQTLRAVELEVLPRNIPNRIEVDVTALVVGQSLHVSDLQIENAEILTDARATICSVIPPRVEEAPAAEAVEEEEEAGVEPELIRKPKDEDAGDSE